VPNVFSKVGVVIVITSVSILGVITKVRRFDKHVTHHWSGQLVPLSRLALDEAAVYAQRRFPLRPRFGGTPRVVWRVGLVAWRRPNPMGGREPPGPSGRHRPRPTPDRAPAIRHHSTHPSSIHQHHSSRHPKIHPQSKPRSQAVKHEDQNQDQTPAWSRSPE
jgi:hypothetical protein